MTTHLLGDLMRSFLTARSFSCRSLLLVGMLLIPSSVFAQIADCPPSLDDLARCDWSELEARFRAGKATVVPPGFTAGRAIPCPSEPLARLRARAIGTAWKGKCFTDDAQIINQWLGFRAVRAEVRLEDSLLDGQAVLVLDYSRTSRVWADVRDEIREVAPGLYLGIMYRKGRCGPERRMFFALQGNACASQP